MSSARPQAAGNGFCCPMKLSDVTALPQAISCGPVDWQEQLIFCLRHSASCFCSVCYHPQQFYSSLGLFWKFVSSLFLKAFLKFTSFIIPLNLSPCSQYQGLILSYFRLYTGVWVFLFFILVWMCFAMLHTQEWDIHVMRDVFQNDCIF